MGEINLQFSYPILHRREEKQQALIAKQQTGNQPWASLNEARQRTGEKALEGKDYPYADEPIVNTKRGPVPYSVWVKQMQLLEDELSDTSTTNNSRAVVEPLLRIRSLLPKKNKTGTRISRIEPNQRELNSGM